MTEQLSIHDMPRETPQDYAAIFMAARERGMPVSAARNYIKAYDGCQSEIERMMLAELGLCPFGYYNDMNEVQFQDDLQDRAKFYGDNAIIVPQARLRPLPYRVDFLVLLNPRGRHPTIPTLVIECDGHDYHERTKEQASRDRKRDRDIQNLGVPILRFTGSEIWRDAAECAAQVDVFGARMLERIWGLN